MLTGFLKCEVWILKRKKLKRYVLFIIKSLVNDSFALHLNSRCVSKAVRLHSLDDSQGRIRPYDCSQHNLNKTKAKTQNRNVCYEINGPGQNG